MHKTHNTKNNNFMRKKNFVFFTVHGLKVICNMYSITWISINKRICCPNVLGGSNCSLISRLFIAAGESRRRGLIQTSLPRPRGQTRSRQKFIRLFTSHHAVDVAANSVEKTRECIMYSVGVYESQGDSRRTATILPLPSLLRDELVPHQFQKNELF